MNPAELTEHDARYAPAADPGPLERLGRRLLRDPRDYPFLKLMMTSALVLWPLAAALYALDSFPWWLGAAYLAVNAFGFLDRFILMHHNTIHRPLFRKEYRAANLIIPWVLAPFFGITPETYAAHHIGMHHPENNLEPDLSSTLRYRRDSLLDFLHYYLKFVFWGLPSLAHYLWVRRRHRLARRMLFGELSFYLMVAGMALVNWQATVVVFVIPFFLVRFLQMAGNWGQHAFVCAEQPENCYRNSITCVNGRYNRRAFNDGYHIGHHLKATMHWTEMPAEFRRNLGEYARQGAIVFQKIDFFVVWLFLMTHQYRLLARYYVHLDPAAPRLSTEQLVELFRARLAPMPSRESAPVRATA
jgi:hypothetical protein